MTAIRKFSGYGWRRDSIDRRDHPFRASIAHLPDAIDLRAQCPGIMEQGPLGACTAHGITSAMRYAAIKQGAKDRPLSRLQLYYDERKIEGTLDSDAGAEIRDGIKCAASIGVASESLWPYQLDKFQKKPSLKVYQNASRNRVVSYQRVGNADGSLSATDLKMALASGYLVVGGFNVFVQFESDDCARTAVVASPHPSERPIGGHCVAFVGYGQKKDHVTAMNSWGTDWGDKGFFYIPEAYLEEQGSDFWVITKVSL